MLNRGESPDQPRSSKALDLAVKHKVAFGKQCSECCFCRLLRKMLRGITIIFEFFLKRLKRNSYHIDAGSILHVPAGDSFR